MAKLAALLLRKLAVAADPALQPGARGARKHVVTELFEKKEVPADTLVWAPPAEGEKCQVIVADGKEVASFTEVTAQDRHFHHQGTEIYMVLSGVMPIEVNDQLLTVGEGDTLIVNPGTIHEVKPLDERFLARVITMDCGGADDKFVV